MTPPGEHGDGRLVLTGACVVVTGAGSGIGAAMARRFAADGARVVVNDLDADAAKAVADEIGGLAHPADIARLDEVSALVEAATTAFGEVDLFCANAGVAVGGTEQTATPGGWELAWQVNVMSHVHAAHVLLPGWLSRGRGRLITTVSAAGILTMLGSAPYSVTKHAALAFSEWLRATYSHRGIVVQSLCPQGVRTPLFDSTGGLGEAVLGETALQPEQVADAVALALEGERFLILPHPEVADFAVRRATDPDRWLAGMNRVQQSVEGAGLL
ncbi:NADP-dependent 3-hydroxy acid dehydrogenase YdfG [Nakamurella sp. UYEF19]|uniref:SDR family oxidoreductase n=1 Tax=Nakamurella sp. UYEF19 TaxID=1756392 RepID=UPI003398746F